MLSATGTVTKVCLCSPRRNHQRRQRLRSQPPHLRRLSHHGLRTRHRSRSRRSTFKQERVSRPQAHLGRRSLSRRTKAGLAHSLHRVKPAQGLERPTSPEMAQVLAAAQAATDPAAGQVETTAVELAVHNLSFVLRSRRNGCWSLGVSDKRGFRSRQAPQPTRRG